jgi:hypothetical protein
MKIYRVGFYTEQDSSIGFDFYTNKKEAETALRKFEKQAGVDKDRSGIDVYDLQLTTKAVLQLLREVGSEPQNG